MKYITILILLFVIGCSKSPVTQTNSEQDSQKISVQKESVITIKNLEAKKHFIQGMTYALEELPEKAVIEFQEALIFEDNPNINFALAVQLYKLNKIDFAIKYLEKALTFPDSEIHSDFLLVAAQIYLTKRDFNKALTQLERLIKIDSTNVEALYNYAQLIESSDKEKAKSIYEKILSLQPENRFALEALLNYYYQKSDYENAEQLLKNLIYVEPSEVDLRLRLAGLYREWGKDDSAKIVLNQVSERFPDNFLSKLYLIEIYLDEKNYSQALSLTRDAFELAMDDSLNKVSLIEYVTVHSLKDSILCDSVFNLLNERYAKKDTSVLPYLFVISSLKNSHQESDELFSKIELDESNLEVLKKFGQQFYIDGKYDLSIYVLEKISHHLENDFDVIVTLGQAYLMKENYVNAVSYLKKSSELNSTNPELFVAISYALGKLKKYDEAIDYSEKALAIDGRNKNALTNLGLLLDDAGYFEKSDSVYELALSIYPDDPTLLNNYAYSLAKRKVNLEKALEMSKKSLAKDSLVGSYLDTLGWIYFQMGKIDEAERYIKLAIDQGSASAEIYEHMGDVYSMMSKKDEAAEYYKMALKLDPENQNIQKKLQELK